jgi:serine/threonine-protein kinase
MSETYRHLNSEANDLATTVVLADRRLGPSPAGPSPEATVALVDARSPSLSDETHTLRRRRLRAAAVFLAVTFGLLTLWVFLSNNPGTNTEGGSRYSLRVGLLATRCALAAAVAALLASGTSLTRTQLRAAEYVLFLGLALLLMSSQYFVGLDLMRRGPEYLPIVVAFVKDGVIQMMALMAIYGTLVPNRPAVAVRALAVMFALPVATTFLLKLHPDVAQYVARLDTAEEAGSNLLFLAIGGALAVYGSFLLNGLRVDLHEARKFGQYRLVRKIGAGGMGEVYLAEHALLKRPCALKLIKPGASADPLALARFEREVQESARLGHHNTIEIYDYGHTDDGTFYYVMQYLRGMDLDQVVRAYGPLPTGRVLHVFRQVCAGLAEAHALGLVHRDLKPANVFLAVLGGEADVAKVLDFGLVKPTRDPGAALTAEAKIAGTPLYMAPEQARDDPALDARADIYALGGMMYFALTGRPPFPGERAIGVLLAHASAPVVPPSEVRPGVPHDVEGVVLRCLAKKPEARYPSVNALADALAACGSASEWDPGRSAAWWASQGLPRDEGPASVVPA